MPVIQGYKEIRPLGKGGFGSVYLVSDDADRLLALKVIMHREIDDYRYNREYESIRTCGDLNNPNLIPILHVGKEEDFFYYTMRLADDAMTGQKLTSKSTAEEIVAYKPKTLSSEIKANGGHLSVKDAIEAVLPVLSALEFLHGKKLLHRDVKPDNIVFLDGKPVLGDIGLVTEQTDEPMTNVASQGYTPPCGVIDVPSDLYSVGMTLYNAIGGTITGVGLPPPTHFIYNPDPLFTDVNKIMLRAAGLKYKSAHKMKTDLIRLAKKVGKPAVLRQQEIKPKEVSLAVRSMQKLFSVVKSLIDSHIYVFKRKPFFILLALLPVIVLVTIARFAIPQKTQSIHSLFDISIGKRPVDGDTIFVSVKANETSAPVSSAKLEIVIIGEGSFPLNPLNGIDDIITVNFDYTADMGYETYEIQVPVAGKQNVYYEVDKLKRLFMVNDKIKWKALEITYKDGEKWLLLNGRHPKITKSNAVK